MSAVEQAQAYPLPKGVTAYPKIDYAYAKFNEHLLWLENNPGTKISQDRVIQLKEEAVDLYSDGIDARDDCELNEAKELLSKSKKTYRKLKKVYGQNTDDDINEISEILTDIKENRICQK